jgi:hypothetical protein
MQLCPSRPVNGHSQPVPLSFATGRLRLAPRRAHRRRRRRPDAYQRVGSAVLRRPRPASPPPHHRQPAPLPRRRPLPRGHDPSRPARRALTRRDPRRLNELRPVPKGSRPRRAGPDPGPDRHEGASGLACPYLPSRCLPRPRVGVSRRRGLFCFGGGTLPPRSPRTRGSPAHRPDPRPTGR